jgi:hypothetical protein
MAFFIVVQTFKDEGIPDFCLTFHGKWGRNSAARRPSALNDYWSVAHVARLERTLNGHPPIAQP